MHLVLIVDVAKIIFATGLGVNLLTEGGHYFSVQYGLKNSHIKYHSSKNKQSFIVL